MVVLLFALMLMDDRMDERIVVDGRAVTTAAATSAAVDVGSATAASGVFDETQTADGVLLLGAMRRRRRQFHGGVVNSLGCSSRSRAGRGGGVTGIGGLRVFASVRQQQLVVVHHRRRRRRHGRIVVILARLVDKQVRSGAVHHGR